MNSKIYDFDPCVSGDPTVSPRTFVWAACGRFRTAPERPFYPLLATTKVRQIGPIVDQQTVRRHFDEYEEEEYPDRTEPDLYRAM